MSGRPLLRSFAVLAIVLGAAPRLWARELTFAERVHAQEAIERVYYAHRIGANQPFEKAVPTGIIEQKVRTYLQLSVALEKRWGARITAGLLEREVERMARSSRMPERLRELFAALGDDAFLVRECLARPVLVERLARGFFASDGNAPGLSWDAWWADAAPSLDFRAVHAVAADDSRLPPIRGVEGSFSPESVCDADHTWDNAALDDVPEGRFFHTAVWTGSVMIVWGGTVPTNRGSKFDPVTDAWSPISAVSAPAARGQHTAVWTGHVIIVWGGPDPGGRYDPDSDTWSPVTTLNAPANRVTHTAVWAGDEMLVWGGSQNGTALNSGGRYDPKLDVWTPMTQVGAPAPRTSSSAVWTGTEMIVWGGIGTGIPTPTLDTGGRYNPASDTWIGTSTIGAPTGRTGHTVVWTGSRMIVWGGTKTNPTTDLATGGLYDPSGDTWSTTSTIDAPSARGSHTAVWTGSRMVVWGGGNFFNTGGRYDPDANAWTPTSTVAVPVGRVAHTAVWTGSQMVIWGGRTDNQGNLNSGGRYDPDADLWTPTTSAAPRYRSGHTAIWTGTLMIVWGGHDRGGGLAGLLDTGDRYDPATDSWSPTSLLGAPEARTYHTAVWTGTRMIVWGGGTPVFPSSYSNTGAQYDPTSNVWTSTSTANAPAGRRSHTAVWTGSKMVVWGGGLDFSGPFDSGGRYDPADDTWASTSMTGAPQARSTHRAVWTGREMIVWGGASSTALLATGGRYDPLADTWTPTSTSGSHPPVRGHTAIWTGAEMLVWGGDASFDDLPVPFPVQGGRLYDPRTDSWRAVSNVGAPTGRSGHSAVWTGGKMILWGGADWTGYTVNSGGVYDLATNTWVPTSSVDAPAPTATHTAVWTGSFMVVWGGNPSGPFGTGGRYALDHGVDNDGDGLSACAGDCNDGDPAVFDAPHEVQDLRWLDAHTLGWDSDAASSGSATRYDLMLGDLLEVGLAGSASGDRCLFDGLATTNASDPSPVPPVGGAWFLLVRGDNVCGKGRWTTRTDGSDRLTTACP